VTAWMVIPPAGILLPESLLYSDWFGVFAAFVAINTMIYVLLSVSKLLPVFRFGRRRKGREFRGETRSIYPNGEDAGGEVPARRAGGRYAAAGETGLAADEDQPAS